MRTDKKSRFCKFANNKSSLQIVNHIKNIIYSLLFTAAIACLTACTQKEKKPDSVFERKAVDLISQMTLDEKLSQLREMNSFDIAPIERLNIPKFRTIYGPFYGVNEVVAEFPAFVALAASWDTTLMHNIGNAYGTETKAYGYDQWLGPCVNLHRLPIGGRNFESSSEDPFLAAEMNIPLIKGIQEKGAIVALKHFALNNQEYFRGSVNMIGDERTLNELYLYAFAECVRRADPYGVMTAYNKINGTYGAENYELITNYLRGKWRFSGFVISDSGGAHRALQTFKSGLDIVLPDESIYSPDSLKSLLSKGLITEKEIDEKLTHFYTIRFKTGLFSAKKESYGNFVEANKNLALKAAQSTIVLLKNENNILPLNQDKIKTIALIGPYGEYPISGGGGSSKVRPAYHVTLIKGISDLTENKVKVLSAEGTLTDNGKPYKLDMNCFFLQRDCKENGFSAEFFPDIHCKGKPALTRTLKDLDLNLNSFFTTGALPDTFSVQLSAFMRLPIEKWYEFFVTSDGCCTTNLEQIYAANIPKTGLMCRSLGQNIYRAGKVYPVVIRYIKTGKNDRLKVEWSHAYNDGKDYLTKAKNMAAKADVVILTAGFNNYYEGEGVDRQREMSGNQDGLIKEILKVNPKTIVVLQSGTPIEIDEWASKAPAIIQQWYNGQECGNALAEALFGKVNPSGKLPFTWVKKYDDSPTMKDYGKDPTKTEFKEGIFMGYRYYDKNKVSVRFPFGHGLSYTTFAYSNLKVKKEFTAKDTLAVTLDVKNTGAVAGKEVVELYVSEKVCPLPRPVKELKAFSKVELSTGETKTVAMKLGKSAFSYYDPSIHDWKAEPGEFEILLGSSSQDIRLSEKVMLQ